MAMGRWMVVVLLCVLLAAFLACSQHGEGAGGDGAVALVASTSAALTSADATSMTVTVSAPDIATPITKSFVQTGGVWQGTIGGIPAGLNRTLTGKAFNAANILIFTGTAPNVAITANNTTSIALVLEQASAVTAFSVQVPRIDSLVVSSNAVAPGDTITLTATAHDPDPTDPITFAWAATGGSFGSPTSATTTWTAGASGSSGTSGASGQSPGSSPPAALRAAPRPGAASGSSRSVLFQRRFSGRHLVPSGGGVASGGSAGLQTVTLSVTDAQGLTATMSVTIQVSPANAKGSASVTVTFNLAPNVTAMNASPTRVDVGASTMVSATASDPEGASLSYAWTVTAPCVGTFATPNTASSVFTLAAPKPGSGNCTLKVTINDGAGGANTGTIGIQTGPGATAEIAPQIDTTYQSSATVDGGGTVTLQASAHDPQNKAMTFTWTATAGTLGARDHDGRSEHGRSGPRHHCIPARA